MTKKELREKFSAIWTVNKSLNVSTEPRVTGSRSELGKLN
jgi:hypothetical protein